MIEVREPGFLTTVQDEGRPGLAHLGVSRGGAADSLSYFFANRLAGNEGPEAALELTLKGGEFHFTDDTFFAVTGSNFSPKLDGEPIELWRTERAKSGQTLALGPTREGARAYLAVKGGIDVPLVLGSRSTFLAAGLGGFEGRALRRGDRLKVGASAAPFKSLRTAFRISWREVTELRFIPGTAWSLFPQSAREAFQNEIYTVSEQSNRSGIRFTGIQLAFSGAREEVSEGVMPGTVQLPPSGQLIVLMNEQGTTGGYPKIAQIVLRDRWRLGQLKPRDKVRFKPVTVEEALALWREHVRSREKAVVVE